MASVVAVCGVGGCRFGASGVPVWGVRARRLTGASQKTQVEAKDAGRGPKSNGVTGESPGGVRLRRSSRARGSEPERAAAL